ncbi:hypothetical protein AOLI_G00063070 [Acnodon oligacanthus]
MPAPAPPGPWECQRRRGPSRPSPPPQPILTYCNRFAALSSPPTPSPMPRASSPAPAPRHSTQASDYVIGSPVVRHVRVLKDHLKKTDARTVISVPLPTYRRGSEQFSRLFTLQSWLRGWCAFNGLGYVDSWSSFWEHPVLYWRDGLHPSHLDSVVLSQNIDRAIH